MPQPAAHDLKPAWKEGGQEKEEQGQIQNQEQKPKSQEQEKEGEESICYI
jgi:hypothetical protein